MPIYLFAWLVLLDEGQKSDSYWKKMMKKKYIQVFDFSFNMQYDFINFLECYILTFFLLKKLLDVA